MGRVGIIGVGHSRFGKRSDASLRELAFEAYREALDDAEIDTSDIDASLVCSATHYDKQRSPAGVVAEYLGLNPAPTFNVEAACASSAVGLRTAWALVNSMTLVLMPTEPPAFSLPPEIRSRNYPTGRYG